MNVNKLLLLFFIIFTHNLIADIPITPEEQNTHLPETLPLPLFHTMDTFDPDFCDFILETAPDEILDRIRIIRNPFCPRRVKPRRLLLHGPSGSGKTTLAQVFAIAIGKPCILINAGLLGNEFVNSTAANLRRAIEPYLHQPCVIIIDEIDCIIKQSTNEKDPEQRTPKQVWEILDMCAQLDNIFLIGITNEVNGLPEPLQTRFAGDTIEVPLINSQEMRKKTIVFHLRGTPYQCDEHFLQSLAKKTSSLSNRELEKLVLTAISLTYLRDFPHYVTQEDFETALQKIQKSRSLLKKWSWSDYEKPLQYTLQIAGLVVNIASLIMSTKNAWDSMALQQKGMQQSEDQANRALGVNIAIADRADKRTVEAFKFQKMSLGASDEMARLIRSYDKGLSGTCGKNDKSCLGAMKLYHESMAELAKYAVQN